MSNVTENAGTTSKESPWSGRQKFWLLAVGCLILIVVGFFLLVALFYSPLNQTERMLIGKWEVVEPVENRGNVILFNSDRLNYSLPRTSRLTFMWDVDEDTLTLTETLDSALVTRLKLNLGFGMHQDRYEIQQLTEDTLEIHNHATGLGARLRRVRDQ